MFKPSVFSRNYKPDTSGRKIVDREPLVQGLVPGGGCNQCVICLVNSCMVAETIDKRNQNWFVRAKVANDLIIQVGDSSFHLHKLPMVMRSGYLNRLVFKTSNVERGTCLKIRIDNLPGGNKIFELVVKFCYGRKVDLAADNIAPLYCAAHFLEMSDDFEEGNLMSKTEEFLSFLIFSSWKDTFQILKSCESISSWAKDYKITKRSSEAIAWKACTNLKAFSHEDEDMQCFRVLPNCVGKSKVEDALDNWWFEDVSSLRVDHFIEVVQSLKCKGMRADLVGSCMAHWTVKWLSRISSGLESMTPKHMTRQYVRVTTECLIKILPAEEKSVTCNFILHLLKIGFVTKINSDLLNLLERRIAFMLDQCRPLDLLVRNYGDKDSVYDVNLVIRVVMAYVSIVSKSPTPKMFAVGRLVDGYLTLVARDENLKMNIFQSLVEALPRDARFCGGNLYRAIDMYLKAHPSLTEEERMTLCGSLEYHRLSEEAREHVKKNDRLPVKITARFILLEQVNMMRSMTAIGSNYRRTKTQAVVRVNKGLGKGWMNSQKELNLMTKDVETIRGQLNDLHMCKLKLQNQLKGCTI
ncbi:putative SKP1/BTB/POZ domain, NPH3 domain-containing protein [Rosa chinensis]|uniref:Putative SKP1/BTB/POZ domain, NPH3 domain-containing protein n=1 Tax=Rosa chinensis TaxID=74649 RepID=A0A2P6R6W2_ROSCH|nr:coleoptile phototropism protein 1 [Rosa chinensis]PRQ42139.1 putative SKP1/BTB/POZ domain, NPH3 domain-containing protein [Rosa chinensis]